MTKENAQDDIDTLDLIAALVSEQCDGYLAGFMQEVRQKICINIVAALATKKQIAPIELSIELDDDGCFQGIAIECNDKRGALEFPVKDAWGGVMPIILAEQVSKMRGFSSGMTLGDLLKSARGAA